MNLVNPKALIRFLQITHHTNICYCTIWPFLAHCVLLCVAAGQHIFLSSIQGVLHIFSRFNTGWPQEARAIAMPPTPVESEQVVSNSMMVDTGCKKMAWPRFSSFIRRRSSVCPFDTVFDLANFTLNKGRFICDTKISKC